MEFQQFQSSCPVTGHCGESLAPSTFLAITYLYTLIRNPGPSIPQAEQLQTSQPFLICQVLWSLNHLHSPVLDLLQKVHIILVLKCQELDLALQIHLTGAEDKGQITSHDLLAKSSWCSPGSHRPPLQQDCTDFLGSLCSPGPQSHCFPGCFPDSQPSTYWLLGLFLP